MEMKLLFYHLLPGDEMNDNLRYSRQIKLPEVGTEGQEKIGKAKVLIVGMGGLGCPAAQYLAAAGVGTLGLMDHDQVDATNLHRQILYGTADIGKAKAETAREKLQHQNEKISFKTYNQGLTIENALEIINDYDIIMDGTDNLQSKYLINDACLLAGKPWVYASIYKYEGQLSVFNYKKGPSYRCLFPKIPQADISCEATGVIGVLPGILGTYQAAEVLKIILGIGQVLSGQLKIIHTLTMQEQTITFKRDEKQVQEVLQRDLRQETNHCQLKDLNQLYLDVREAHEQPKPEQEVLKIPMPQLQQRYREIPQDKAVHVFCQSGIRSRQAIQILQEKYGFKNLINVEGGIQSLLK